MRKIVGVFALAIVLSYSFGIVGARAQLRDCVAGHSGPPPATQGTAPDSLKCIGDEPGSTTSNVNGRSDSGSVSLVSTNGSAPTKRYVPYNRLATGPEGQPCATTGYVEEGTTPSDERLLLDPNPEERKGPNYRDVLEDYPPCPVQPLAPGSVAPLETRAMVAARAWERRVPLLKPQPKIAPGRAITGKLAYLETRGQISDNYTEDTMFGPLRITAQGSYTVAWGDGVTTGPHGFEGLPWPSGEITHDYLSVGTYDIVVTERWTASWSLDGESGVLRTLQTTGRIDDFPVEQIQAVIGR